MNKQCDYSLTEFGRKCVKKNTATKLVRITYGRLDEDVFYLCESCATLVEQEAKKAGNQCKVRDLSK